MLSSLMNDTATVYRLQQAATSGDDKYIERWEATGTEVRCAVQPADATDTAMTEGQYGRAFKMFCERSVSLKVGDKILFGGRDYYVRGVQDYEYGRFVSHKEAVLHLPIVQADVVDIYVSEAEEDLLTEGGDLLGVE